MREKKVRVAIIGGGVGGFACAYFLMQDSEHKYKMDLFEKNNKIGGRIMSNYESSAYEFGASIIHEQNKYLVNFRKIFGLKKRGDKPNSGLAIYLGENSTNGKPIYSYISLLDFFSCLNWAFDGLRLILACGLWDFCKLWWHTHCIIKKFKRIYRLQTKGNNPKYYTRIENMLSDLGLLHLAYIPLVSYLKQELKLGPKIMANIVLPAIRVNYGQGLDVPAFVGIVSLAACINSNSLWSFENGNWVVVEALLNHLTKHNPTDKVNKIKDNNNDETKLKQPHDFRLHLDQEVKSIKFDLESSKYSLTFVTENSQTPVLYDFVIVARPATSPKDLYTYPDPLFTYNFEILINPDDKILENLGSGNIERPTNSNQLVYHPLWVYIIPKTHAQLNNAHFGPTEHRNVLFPFLAKRPVYSIGNIFTSHLQSGSHPNDAQNELAETFNSIGTVFPLNEPKKPKNIILKLFFAMFNQLCVAITYYSQYLKLLIGGFKHHSIEKSSNFEAGEAWKIFSNAQLSPDTIQNVLFTPRTTTNLQNLPKNSKNLADDNLLKHVIPFTEHYWAQGAYPEYNKLWDHTKGFYQFPSIVLHEAPKGGAVYHLNAIEWAASAMEMSCIGAKNAALLVRHRISQSR